jgi:DNA polymerase-3 subunit gamma/tau
LRDALSLLDQAIAYCGGKVEQAPVAIMLGTIDREHVSRLIALLTSGDAAGIIAALGEIDTQFPDYSRLLEDLARDLQKIAVFQVVGNIDSDEELSNEHIAGVAEQLSAADVQLFYQTALIGRRDLHLAPDPKSGAEMTLLRMLAFRPAQSGQSGEPVTSGGTAASKAAPKRSQAEPAARAVQAQASETSDKPRWQDPDWNSLLSEIGLAGAVRLLAGNCAFLRREGDTVFLSLDPRSESMLTRQRKEALAKALSEHFSEQLLVDISLGEAVVDTPMQEETRLADEQIDAARESLESDPNIQALKDMFDAELKTDSIELINPTQSD